MSYYLAPSLAQLRAEVNARWPGRSKRSDGWIGDRAHRNRKSDHNPNSRGSVNAFDFTVQGIDKAALIAAAKRHPSVQYIISDRKIMNRDIGNFRARHYSGANPHTAHVHISIRQNRSAEQDTRSWGIANASGDTGGGSTYREVKYGDMLRLYTKGAPVKEWQKVVGVKADGYFGPSTASATKKWQKANGLAADGIVGPKTWAKYKSGSKPSKPKKGKPFPLPKGHFYYTESRRAVVHSGYWSKDRPAIREIQKKVGAGVDGGYGAKTKAAVQRWQKKNGIKADGAVGPATWSKMFG